MRILYRGFKVDRSQARLPVRPIICLGYPQVVLLALRNNRGNRVESTRGPVRAPSIPIRRHELHQFVIVSGLPASGKTTLACALALELDFPLLDKDSFLEALFATEGPGNSEWRRGLSKRADMSLREAALAKRRAVITSWWRHPRSTADSGTPADWLAPVPSFVEVHCICSASVAAARFLACTRHPGHLDHQRSVDCLLSLLEE